MNDHLIKNLKISLFWNVLGSFIIIAFVFYITIKIEAFNWYIWLIYLSYPVYIYFKRNKIILEILINNDDVTIKSYSILTGKKELNIKLNEIIELDFFRGFVIKYKSSSRKETEIFQINAEPWNNIYGEIKSLKLKVQEMDKQNMKN